jgi:hypothetical protein
MEHQLAETLHQTMNPNFSLLAGGGELGAIEVLPGGSILANYTDV